MAGHSSARRPLFASIGHGRLSLPLGGIFFGKLSTRRDVALELLKAEAVPAASQPSPVPTDLRSRPLSADIAFLAPLPFSPKHLPPVLAPISAGKEDASGAFQGPQVAPSAEDSVDDTLVVQGAAIDLGGVAGRERGANEDVDLSLRLQRRESWWQAIVQHMYLSTRRPSARSITYCVCGSTQACKAKGNG